jgi:hypothetical protein
LTTGHFYPEYPAMAKLWSLGKYYGGEFVARSPAIQPYQIMLPGASEILKIVGSNFLTLLKTAAWELGAFGPFFILAVIGLKSGKARRDKYLFCFGAAFLIFHASSYYWVTLSSDPFTPLRYIIFTAAFWYPVSAIGVNRVASHFGRTWERSLFVLLWFLLTVPMLKQFIGAQSEAALVNQSRVLALQQTMQSFCALTRPDDLVAIVGGGIEMCGSMFLERPSISLPEGKMDTVENVIRLIQLFHPKLIVPGRSRSAAQAASRMSYRKALVSNVSPDITAGVAFIAPE